MTVRVVIPDDQNLLLLTAIVTISYQLIFFFIAAYFKFDKVTDLAGGTNFVILALMTFSLGAVEYPIISHQQYAMTVLVTVWGIRLSCFLFYRIMMIAEDHRFDNMRDDPFKFIYFWIFQMMWVWIVSLPLTYINSIQFEHVELNYVDRIGIAFASFGLVIETLADNSKYAFKRDKRNNGKWCDAGIWKYSRHPNYFGELLFWWSIFIGCSSTFTGPLSIGYYTVVSPIFVTLLLFGLSGLPLLEKGSNSRFGTNESYHQYLRDTSILIPLPNWFYRNLPNIVKAVLLFEWPFYSALFSPTYSSFFFSFLSPFSLLFLIIPSIVAVLLFEWPFYTAGLPTLSAPGQESSIGLVKVAPPPEGERGDEKASNDTV